MGKYVAEFIGTFTLIFIGAGSIIADHQTGGAVGIAGIALAHGLAIACMVSATAAVSGGHLNPAVTIGLLATGHIKGAAAIGYIVAQCLGGIAAAAVLNMSSFPDSIAATGLATPALGANISVMQGLIMEVVLTFFLMFVVYGTAVDGRAPKMAGLFIGLTVAFDVLAGGPVTGAAMNPARHLGPAIVSGTMLNTWLYWVGPVVGAVLAATIYKSTIEAKA